MGSIYFSYEPEELADDANQDGLVASTVSKIVGSITGSNSPERRTEIKTTTMPVPKMFRMATPVNQKPAFDKKNPAIIKNAEEYELPSDIIQMDKQLARFKNIRTESFSSVCEPSPGIKNENKFYLTDEELRAKQGDWNLVSPAQKSNVTPKNFKFNTLDIGSDKKVTTTEVIPFANVNEFAPIDEVDERKRKEK